MKVLVPLPFDVSNLAHGRNLRIVHLLRGLSGCCEVTCVTPDQQRTDAAQSVLPRMRIITAGAGRASADDAAARAWGPYRIRRAIAFLGCERTLLAETTRRAPESDAVLGFDLPSAAYLLAASGPPEDRLLNCGTHAGRPRTVCDVIDDPWLSRQSLPPVYRWSPTGIKAALAIRAIRRRVLSRIDALTAVAPRDAASLSRATGMNVTVVPNGVELPEGFTTSVEREPLVVFTGSMDFPPNATAAEYLLRQIWPQVRRRLNERACGGGELAPRLAIVGANPTLQLQRLAAGAGVLVTGRVESVADWLARAQVAVAPMVSGCGIKNKILEAWAAGCPVVSTSLGAAGLPTGPGSGISVTDTPGQIADEIAALLVNPARAQAIGSAGHALARERFSWSNAARTLREVLAGNDQPTLRTIAQTAGRQPARLQPEPPADNERPHDEEALIHAAS